MGKKPIQLLAVLFVCFITLAFFTKKETDTSKYIPIRDAITFSATVPTDPEGGYTATPQQMATFAWQEFVALNWPAAVNTNPSSSGFTRGTPSNDAFGATGSGGTVVWETYAHRAELYPAKQTGESSVPDLAPIQDAPIKYQYPSFFSIIPGAGASVNLFNNLDEASEITLADMYYTPMATPNTVKASILYEAKANNVIYNYVKKNKFQDPITRSAAATNTLAKISNQTYSNPTFEFPKGSIEIKATWRRYDATADNLKDFHYTTAIWYSGKSPTFQAHNDIFLLIGLHIIQKTPSFPTFTFATFEHNSNEKNGFQFVNTHAEVDSTTIAGRSIPEGGVVKAIRQFPIPDGTNGSFDLVGFNTEIQKQLKSQFGDAIVWANYQLIGVQGQIANNPTKEVPPQTFFLSNFATETNNALQFFQGTLSGAFSNILDPNTPKVSKQVLQNDGSLKFELFTAGGCVGCHGAQGQSKGFDFSVISAKNNFFLIEPPEDYPAGTVVNQNTEGFPLKQTAN